MQKNKKLSDGDIVRLNDALVRTVIVLVVVNIIALICMLTR